MKLIMESWREYINMLESDEEMFEKLYKLQVFQIKSGPLWPPPEGVSVDELVVTVDEMLNGWQLSDEAARELDRKEFKDLFHNRPRFSTHDITHQWLNDVEDLIDRIAGKGAGPDFRAITESLRRCLVEGDLVSDPRIIVRLVINGSVDDAHKLMMQTGIDPDLVIRPLVVKLIQDREAALEYAEAVKKVTTLDPDQPTLKELYKLNDRWRELYEDIYYFAKGEDPEWAPPYDWPYIRSDKEYFVNLYKELSAAAN